MERCLLLVFKTRQALWYCGVYVASGGVNVLLVVKWLLFHADTTSGCCCWWCRACTSDCALSAYGFWRMAGRLIFDCMVVVSAVGHAVHYQRASHMPALVALATALAHVNAAGFEVTLRGPVL